MHVADRNRGSIGNIPSSTFLTLSKERMFSKYYGLLLVIAVSLLVPCFGNVLSKCEMEQLKKECGLKIKDEGRNKILGALGTANIGQFPWAAYIESGGSEFPPYNRR